MEHRGSGDRKNKNEGRNGRDDLAWFVYCFFAWVLFAWLSPAEVQQAYSEHNALPPSTSRVEQMYLRTKRGVQLPIVGSTDGDGTWSDIDTVLASWRTAPDHLVILVNIDPEGEHNVPVAEQLPEVQASLQGINDIDPVDPAEADMDLLLVQGEVVGLLRQIERDEANLVRSPQVPQPMAEEASVPLSFVPDVSSGVSQNLLILPAVQQALIPAVEAVDSASQEIETAVFQAQNEANSVSCPPVPRTSTSEGALVPPELVGSVAVRGSQHLPTVLQESVAFDTLEDDIDAVDAQAHKILSDEASERAISPVDATEPEITGTDGLEPEITGTDGLEPDNGAAENRAIDALGLQQEIETDEANTNSLELKKVEDEAGGPSIQPILLLASSDPIHPRVATAILSIPAGDLSSHLEERMPPAATKESVTEAVADLLKDVEEGEPEVMRSG